MFEVKYFFKEIQPNFFTFIIKNWGNLLQRNNFFWGNSFFQFFSFNFLFLSYKKKFLQNKNILSKINIRIKKKIEETTLDKLDFLFFLTCNVPTLPRRPTVLKDAPSIHLDERVNWSTYFRRYRLYVRVICSINSLDKKTFDHRAG